MSLNQIAYLKNPATSKTAGTTVNAGTSATATLYTLGSGETKLITSFVITAIVSGTAGTDYCIATITIGAAKATVLLNGSSTATQITVKLSDLGIAPGFLQNGDVISVAIATTGSPTGSISYSVTLDEYQA